MKLRDEPIWHLMNQLHKQKRYEYYRRMDKIFLGKIFNLLESETISKKKYHSVYGNIDYLEFKIENKFSKLFVIYRDSFKPMLQGLFIQKLYNCFRSGYLAIVSRDQKKIEIVKVSDLHEMILENSKGYFFHKSCHITDLFQIPKNLLNSFYMVLETFDRVIRHELINILDGQNHFGPDYKLTRYMEAIA